jgi:hypothetical protein
MGRKLAARPVDAVEELRAKYEKLQARDLGTVRAINRFADLPSRLEDPEGEQIAAMLSLSDDELKIIGWTRRELRLAYYGTRPKKDWPAAAQAAHERVGMRIRKQGAVKSASTFNLNVINIPAQKPAEPSRVITIDVEEKPET